jgi:RNA-binding protein
MALSSKQVRYLRSLAHGLNPAVQLGKGGYSKALVTEVARNLADHELIKVRLGGDDRVEFAAQAETLASDPDSALVQTIGRIAVLYRPSEEKLIRLP